MYYLISYDIRDDQTRDELAKELSDLGAENVLLSQWELDEDVIDMSLNELFESLRDLMDKDDGLLIVRYPHTLQFRMYQEPEDLDPE